MRIAKEIVGTDGQSLRFGIFSIKFAVFYVAYLSFFVIRT